MIYWQNRILTNVKISLGDMCKTVSSVINGSKAKLPACAVQIVYNNSIADDLEPGDSENAVYCGVHVEAYSKTSLQDAVSIMDVANTAMYRMGFKRRQGPIQTTSTESPELYRLASRYDRVIGADDVIERFE